MFKIPRFKIYGENDKEIQEKISPKLELREWDDLSAEEKTIAYKSFSKPHEYWFDQAVIEVINYLNQKYLRALPGKNLFEANYENAPLEYILEAAYRDFKRIFLEEKQELVFFVLSAFVNFRISEESLNHLELEEEHSFLSEEELNLKINEAFKVADNQINSLNHIFEQFGVNYVFSRQGLFPRQDNKIIEEIYQPTLKVLSNPKWKYVNGHLTKMFEDYRSKNYGGVCDEAYTTMYAFLQETQNVQNNAKGDFKNLFNEKALSAKTGCINRFLKNIESLISDARANHGESAKPDGENKTELSSCESLLVMNEVMILLQYWLTS